MVRQHFEFKAVAVTGPADVATLNMHGTDGYQLVNVTLEGIAWMQREIPDWEWNERSKPETDATDVADDYAITDSVVTDEGRLCVVSAINYDGAIALYDLTVVNTDPYAEPEVLEGVPSEFIRRAGPEDVAEVPVIERTADDPQPGTDGKEPQRRALGAARAPGYDT